jgi:hypothetical protein
LGEALGFVRLARKSHHNAANRVNLLARNTLNRRSQYTTVFIAQLQGVRTQHLTALHPRSGEIYGLAAFFAICFAGDHDFVLCDDVLSRGCAVILVVRLYFVGLLFLSLGLRTLRLCRQRCCSWRIGGISTSCWLFHRGRCRRSRRNARGIAVRVFGRRGVSIFLCRAMRRRRA